MISQWRIWSSGIYEGWRAEMGILEWWNSGIQPFWNAFFLDTWNSVTLESLSTQGLSSGKARPLLLGRARCVEAATLATFKGDLGIEG